jgi:hypothetical protein
MSRRVRLLRHPASGAVSPLQIDVETVRRSSQCTLTYVLRGDLSHLYVPPKTIPARADALWQHTCFEFFVGAADSPAYWEFNFSPSLQWAAYRFSGYREGMATEMSFSTSRVELQSTATVFRLSATLDVSQIRPLATGEVWRVGLCAVLEDDSQNRSYWALAHPSEKPDFHHADSFSLELRDEQQR